MYRVHRQCRCVCDVKMPLVMLLWPACDDMLRHQLIFGQVHLAKVLPELNRDDISMANR
jgi:hypothetical protein